MYLLNGGVDPFLAVEVLGVGCQAPFHHVLPHRVLVDVRFPEFPLQEGVPGAQQVARVESATLVDLIDGHLDDLIDDVGERGCPPHERVHAVRRLEEDFLDEEVAPAEQRHQRAERTYVAQLGHDLGGRFGVRHGVGIPQCDAVLPSQRPSLRPLLVGQPCLDLLARPTRLGLLHGEFAHPDCVCGVLVDLDEFTSVGGGWLFPQEGLLVALAVDQSHDDGAIVMVTVFQRELEHGIAHQRVSHHHCVGRDRAFLAAEGDAPFRGLLRALPRVGTDNGAYTGCGHGQPTELFFLEVGHQPFHFHEGVEEVPIDGRAASEHGVHVRIVCPLPLGADYVCV